MNFREAAEEFVQDHIRRQQNEDPSPTIFCWYCRGVRRAAYGFMRYECLTCGRVSELGAEWKDA